MKTTSNHKQHVSEKITAAILTISSTKRYEDDVSGKKIKEMLGKKGHIIQEYAIIDDDQEVIRTKVEELTGNPDIMAVITTGGTGITARDVTIEAVKPLYKKELVGFQLLFNMLSFKAVGSASILSRASAGVINNTPVFSLPGSPDAVELGVKEIIMPELGHIVNHLHE